MKGAGTHQQDAEFWPGTLACQGLEACVQLKLSLSVLQSLLVYGRQLMF